MNGLARDIRYAIRMLYQNPGFTAVALLSLALGIGANTTIFSVIDAVLLRPLPYRDSDRLVMVAETRRDRPGGWGVSAPNFADWRKQKTVFEELSAARYSWSAVLTGGQEAYRFEGHLVTEGYFSILGGETILGRVFLPEDYQKGESGVLVLSHGFWQRHFGSDPGVVGKRVQVDGRPFTIVGVMSRRFRPLFSDSVDLWAPQPFRSPRPESRGFRYLTVIGRLRGGASIAQAQAEMDAIAARLAQEYPKANKGWRARVDPLQKGVVGWARTRLLVLFGAVCFVLLIACANVANLMLARAAARQKEIAIRSSLGASRARLVQQLLTESVLLAVLGGALGLLVASWGLELLVAFSPGGIPRLDEIAVNSRIFGFTFSVALLTGLLFGLVPALTASKPDMNESLKEARRQGSGGFVRQRARRVLAVSEVALALVLLIGAGLMFTSFLRLQWVPLGFNPNNVVTMQVHLPRGKYAITVGKASDGDNLRQLTSQATFFREEALRRLSALPGVEAASIAAYGPLSGCYGGDFSIEGRAPAASGAEPPWVCVHPISTDYFRALRVPLRKGRVFEERDRHDAPSVAIINETMAKHYFPGQDPIGKRVTITSEDEPDQPREIVGVVGDVRQILRFETFPEVYVPFFQQRIAFSGRYQPRRIQTVFVIRSTNDPRTVAAAVRRVVAELDKDLPIFAVETPEQSRADQLRYTTFYMLLLAAFAGIAVTLSVIGVYGVVSYSAAQRTHEIGIRMALGADRKDILKLVMKEGLMLALIGVAIGVAASVGLTRLIASQLYGVKATDPITFGMVSLLLLVVVLVASYIPARRASKVEPMVALRDE
jgi:putative ABC transport system permease protein